MRNSLTAFAVAGLVALPACGSSDWVSRSSAETRDFPRAPVAVQALNMVEDQGFDSWLSGFRGRATAQGISPRTFDTAFAGVGYVPEVIQRDRNQAEFTRSIWQYLDSAVSDTRIENGRKALAENRRVLDEIEARYGVEREVVVAVWGMESSYGSHRGTMPVIPSLATLAYDGRRGAFFEQQLVAALKIIQAGDVDARHMTGSWAGAMGHTQFIPTSYLLYAVDFHGDGKRDIWSDDPSDALASTAAYLARSGWTRGQPWGVEVVLPAGFNHSLAGKGTRKSVAEWSSLGIRSADGTRLRDHGAASVLQPAGASGPAFLIFNNFRAISRYNAADSYVMGVGHLSDRLKGGGPFLTAWPRTDRALTQSERTELQQRLARAGFDPGSADGKIGPDTIAAIRGYQVASGMTPDGYPSYDLLNRLR
ncbi:MULTISPECIES: lytic murein transglycosylase [unclassified Haematobacter]|uniref:lytic murein transglycosylase n=1 Tax=unclassified Haematobacter TaxID=2640585 RepID=UPI0039183C59